MSLQGSVFSRGLPPVGDLKKPSTGKILAMVTVAQESRVLAKDLPTKDLVELFDNCVKSGWLYSQAGDASDSSTIRYFFPSNLHLWYVQWKLFVDIEEGDIKEGNIVDFVVNVICRFDPRVLLGERTIGPGAAQSIPEAQYQDEFYRCAHLHSGGSVATFPEFGTTRGRADFYMKSKKWAIELLRNGDRLEEHVKRFTQGGKYSHLDIDDYIVLDCRTTTPKIAHSSKYSCFPRRVVLLFTNNVDEGLAKLYHVVFENGYTTVKVLNHNLNICTEFMLVA